MTNNETQADIVREMRTFGERCDHRPFSWQMVDGLFKRLADRIEAAAKRERNRQYEPTCHWSIRDALALANTLANHGLRDGNADAASSCIYSLCRILSSPGNASALRAALEAMLDECCNLCDVPNQMTESGHACNWRDRWSGCQSKAIDKARAALAAPPRNCDVGTAQEQEERLNEFCSSHFEHCSKCPLFDKFRFCQSAWMQLPYEKEGAPK